MIISAAIILAYLIFSWSFGLYVCDFKLKGNIKYILYACPVFFGILCCFAVGFSLVWVLLKVYELKYEKT